MSTVAQIKSAIYGWLSKAMGEVHIFKILFDADFVPGNLIDGSFDLEPIEQVPFALDQSTSLANLAKAIQLTGSIFACTVTGARELTCVGALKGHQIVIQGPTVSGGDSQPLSEIVQVQAPLRVTVIEGDQTAPRPQKPYAYFRLGVERSLGLRDEWRGWTEEGFSALAGQRIVTVQVQVLGNGALQYLRDARRELNFEAVREDLAQFGLAFLESEPLQNLTEFLETISEERAAMDFRFGHAENYLEDLYPIEHVEIEANAQGYTDEKVIDLP